MAPKPAFSITLPRNFQYHYNDPLPSTPEPQSQDKDEGVADPPAPPKQTFKIRRRKGSSVPRDILSDMEADDLPTIEMTEAESELSTLEGDRAFEPGYLAPQATRAPLLPPPKTPLSQIINTIDSKPADWSYFHSDSIERPNSSCSSFSDSSVESKTGSLHSFPSFDSLNGDGSCTSADSDNNDVFTASRAKEEGQPMFSPDLKNTSPVAKRSKTNRNGQWTDEADGHLLQTYQKYLQDPELTPFKLLPGTAPPLGVCSRVAREAKHSWKGSKTWSHWPSNESGTRKRLRQLCKNQPSLPVYYSRLVKLRTPSPFESSSSSPRSRTDLQPSSYGRQMQSVLARAQSDATVPQIPSEPPTVAVAAANRPDACLHRVGRTQAHQKSQSLQIALGRNHFHPQLESPFDENPFRTLPRTSAAPAATGSLTSDTAMANATPSVLRSPLELHAPVPSNRSSLKRRHGILDESSDNVNRLEKLFGGHVAGHGRPPLRDRSFSLGAVRHSSRNLSLSFQRAPIPELPQRELEHNGVEQLRSPLHDPTRLGSPFIASSHSHQHHTFPRNVNNGMADLQSASQNPRPNQSLEGRFRALAAQAALQK